MEKKFDQLLNEKCSWSYRSQIVTSNTKTNADDSSLQLKSTVMTIEIAENNYDEFDDAEDKSQQKSVSKIPKKINSTKNRRKSLKMIPNKSCTLEKQSANSKNARTVKKRMKVQISKEPPIPSSGRILRKKNPKLVNEMDTSSSTSEDEVLQTRFSLKDKNVCIESEDSDQASQIIVSDKEIVSDIDITLASLDVKKTSPIIIQAIPYKKNDYDDDTNKTETVKQSSEDIRKLRGNKNEYNNFNEQLKYKSSEELKKIETISADSLSVEASTPNSEIESSCNEIINSEQTDISKNNNNENISPQIDVKNAEKDDSIIQSTDESKIASDDHISDDSITQPTDESKIASDDHITDDSITQPTDESKIASNDRIIDDFLNGTFDVSIYTPKKTCLTENYKDKTNSNVIMKVKNHEIQSNTVSSDLTSCTDIDKSFSKSEQNHFYGGSKRCKSNNLQDAEKKFFDIPATDDIPFSRKLSKKLDEITKQLKTPLGNKSKNKLGIFAEDFDLGLNGEFGQKIAKDTKKKKKKRKKLSQFKDISANPFNFSNSDNEDQSSKIMKHSKARKKNNKNSNTSMESTEVHTRRNTRNSSLIASRRIKEIEKLENVPEDPDEMDIQSEQDAKYTSVLQKIKQNMDKNINKFDFKKASNCIKKNNATSSHTGERKNINSYDSDYTNLNILDSDDNASFYSFTKDKTENENTRILDSYDNASLHSLIKVKTENEKKSRRNKRKFQDNLLKYKSDKHSFSQINGNRLQMSNKFISDMNFSNEKYSSADEVKNNWLVQKKHKNRKIDSNKEIVKARDEILSCNDKINEKKLRRNVKDIKHEKIVTESKQRTWSDLENELLNELDNGIPLSNARNVFQTITLKREKSVRKEGAVDDTNLVTVSNTSMTQTISKSAKGDSYNMQYAIQNTESKYMENRANTSKCQNSVLKGIIRTNPKNKTILEKTIAAMEECTANFIPPQQAITWQNKWSGSNSLLKEIPDNLNSDHDILQINDTTFSASDENEQYTSNEITDDTQHLRQKKSKSYKKNVSRISSDYDLLKQKTSKSSDNDNYLTNDIYKNSQFKNNADKDKNVENQVLATFTIKTDDPWGKLMKNLNVEQNTQNGWFINNLNEGPQNVGKFAHIMDLSTNEELNKQLIVNKTYFKHNYTGAINKNSKRKDLESLNNESECSVKSIPNNQIDLLKKHEGEFDFNACDNLSELDTGSRKVGNTSTERVPNKRNANERENLKKNLQGNKKYNDNFTENTNRDDEILDVENLNEKESEWTNLNIIPYGEIDLLKDCNDKFSFDALDNLLTDNESQDDENTVEKTILIKENKNEVRNNAVTPARKRGKKERTALPLTDTKSPKYKFKAGKDGCLKLKLHSSKSSTASSSSENFSKGKNFSKNAKNKHYTRSKTNKARERYIKYIKNIDEKEDSGLEKDATSTQDNNYVKTPSNLMPDKDLNLVQDKTNGAKNIKLIAEKDEDVFSLSSSDSEASDKEIPRGSGLLCEFFD